MNRSPGRMDKQKGVLMNDIAIEVTNQQQHPLVPYMRKRVQAGIQWLNNRDEAFWGAFCEHYDIERGTILNGDWVAKLDLGDLDLLSDTYCVLGQAGGGSYDRVIDYAGLGGYSASELGFYISKSEYKVEMGEHPADYLLADFLHSSEENNFYWSLLTEVWIEEILALRAKIQELS